MARIIIADDDDIVGEIVSETLISGGHACGVLTDGENALRVIRSKRPDLVILDCNMPGLDGIHVLRELRNSPDFWDLPVLVLTGRTSKMDSDLIFYEGANEYMSKPFDPDELLFRVNEMLAKQASRSR